MTLKAVVENLDDIPESLHGEYVERNGKFYLDVDDSFKEHVNVLPLARSLDSLKRTRDTLQTKVTTLEARTAGLPEDFDPATYAEIKAEYERLKADPANKDAAGQAMREQYETRIRNMEQTHAAALASEQQKSQGFEVELNNRIVGDGLTEALTSAGVESKFLKATRSMLMGAVKVHVEDGQRRAVVETDIGEVDVKQFVENWAKSDEGKAFVTPPTGGGAGGSNASRTVDNPFSYANWNVTEQSRIAREKGRPEAERLAKAAGTTFGGARPPAPAAPARA